MKRKVEAGDEIFKITKYQLLCAGNWPLIKHWPKQWQFCYTIYSYIANFMVYSSAVDVAILFVITLLFEKKPEKAVQLLSFFVIISLVGIKMYFGYSEEMASLIQEGIEKSNAISKDYFNVAGSYLGYCKTLNSLILVFSYVGIVGYALQAEIQIYDYRNAHPDGEQPTHLLIFWHPFNTTKYFNFAFYSEIIRSTFFALNNSITQSLFATLMLHSASQLKVLKYNFTNFHYEDIENEKVAIQEKAYLQLKVIIREHQAMIRYVKRLNESLKYLLLVEYNVSSLMIASVVIQILKGDNILFNVTYLIILTVQLLVVCCNANEIQIQSTDIGFGLYDSQWYQYGKEVRQAIQIVMMRSAKPLSITIGPFGDISARTALERLKLAYSYVSIMPGGNL